MNCVLLKYYNLKTCELTKNSKNIDSVYFHNISSESYKDKELINRLDGLTYLEVSKKVISELTSLGTIKRKPRFDSVYGIEIDIPFTLKRYDDKLLESWSKICIGWVEEFFNPPQKLISYNSMIYTTENLKHCVFHVDDEDKPHLHFFVVPVNNEGHLVHNFYTGNKHRRQDIMTELSKRLEYLGFFRGVKYTTASREQIKKYYEYLDAPMVEDLPKPMEAESIDKYFERLNTCLRIQQIHFAKEIQDQKSLFQQQKGVAYREMQERQKSNLILEADPDRLEELIMKYKNEKAFLRALECYPDKVMAEKVKILYLKMQRTRNKLSRGGKY